MALFSKAKRPNNTVEEAGNLSAYGLYTHGVKPNVNVSPSSYLVHSGVSHKRYGKNARSCHPDAIGSPSKRSFNVTSTEYSSARRKAMQESRRRKLVTPRKPEKLHFETGVSPKAGKSKRKKSQKSIPHSLLLSPVKRSEETEELSCVVSESAEKVRELERELEDSLNRLKYRRYLKEASTARKNLLSSGMKTGSKAWRPEKESRKPKFDRMTERLKKRQAEIESQERMDVICFEEESKVSLAEEKLMNHRQGKRCESVESLGLNLLSFLQDENLRDELSKLLIEQL
mmetsp:Transcript_8852/g.10595  ORF Transcript_8852/g.10595 Transcript_8852/m.10595 type:complete len:287 (+) Transcript_8852:175-1035(+)